MHSQAHLQPRLFATLKSHITTSVILLSLVAIFGQAAPAQSFQVVYSFTGGWDSANPWGLNIDGSGNLYGLTSHTIFELSQRQTQWRLSTLFNRVLQDHPLPGYGITLGPDGNLYWADSGGTGSGCGGPCGEVVQLQRPATVCKTALCPWTWNQIYEFPIYWSGFSPDSRVVFDQQGVLYGTTFYGGDYGWPPGWGVLYYVSPVNGGWQGGKIHDFGWNYPNGDGAHPAGSLLIDRSGNLYGATESGGPNYGTVYTIGQGGESIIYPYDLTLALIDNAGNLYGDGDGGVVELSPSSPYWTLTEVHPLPRGGGVAAMDSAGNLYGMTGCCIDPGSIFKLSRTGTTWSYTDLYEFTGGSDGFGPNTLVLDGAGNLYGTTSFGGNPSCNNGQFPPGCGVIFKITLN